MSLFTAVFYQTCRWEYDNPTGNENANGGGQFVLMTHFMWTPGHTHETRQCETTRDSRTTAVMETSARRSSSDEMSVEPTRISCGSVFSVS